MKKIIFMAVLLTLSAMAYIYINQYIQKPTPTFDVITDTKESGFAGHDVINPADLIEPQNK